jgi:hypothetical protein
LDRTIQSFRCNVYSSIPSIRLFLNHCTREVRFSGYFAVAPFREHLHLLYDHTHKCYQQNQTNPGESCRFHTLWQDLKRSYVAHPRTNSLLLRQCTSHRPLWYRTVYCACGHPRELEIRESQSRGLDPFHQSLARKEPRHACTDNNHICVNRARISAVFTSDARGQHDHRKNTEESGLVETHLEQFLC